MACKQSGDRGAAITGVEATDSYEEQVELARVGLVDTTAVTVKITAGSREQTTTLHVVNVDGAWRWGMTEDELVECGG